MLNSRRGVKWHHLTDRLVLAYVFGSKLYSISWSIVSIVRYYACVSLFCRFCSLLKTWAKMDRKDEENKISGENVVVDRDQTLYRSRSSQSQEAQKLQRIAIRGIINHDQVKVRGFRICEWSRSTSLTDRDQGRQIRVFLQISNLNANFRWGIIYKPSLTTRSPRPP